MRQSSSSRRGRVLLPILIAVLAVLAIAGGVYWFVLRAPAKPSVEEGRAAAESFLGAIQEGHAGEAWESTTAEFKSLKGRETFERYVKAHPILKTPMEYISAQTVDMGGQNREEFIYRAPEYEDGKQTVRLLIANEGGTWKVDHLVGE